MFGPVINHAPCDLALQRRILEARRAALIPRRRRRGSRARAQAPSADLARAAFSGSEDVWRSLRSG